MTSKERVYNSPHPSLNGVRMQTQQSQEHFYHENANLEFCYQLEFLAAVVQRNTTTRAVITTVSLTDREILNFRV